MTSVYFGTSSIESFTKDLNEQNLSSEFFIEKARSRELSDGVKNAQRIIYNCRKFDAVTNYWITKTQTEF